MVKKVIFPVILVIGLLIGACSPDQCPTFEVSKSGTIEDVSNEQKT